MLSLGIKFFFGNKPPYFAFKISSCRCNSQSCPNFSGAASGSGPQDDCKQRQIRQVKANIENNGRAICSKMDKIEGSNECSIDAPTNRPSTSRRKPRYACSAGREIHSCQILYKSNLNISFLRNIAHLGSFQLPSLVLLVSKGSVSSSGFPTRLCFCLC